MHGTRSREREGDFVILNERELEMAQELARRIVAAEKDKEISMRKAARERQRQANQEVMESLGRIIRNVQNAYINGFVKPVNEAKKAMMKGYLG